MPSINGIHIDEADLQNGYSAADIFKCKSRQGITFDDLISLPGTIDFIVADVKLQTKVTKTITLNSPFCSSPMDTVTEHKMAIGMALNGGVGFIHCHCPIESQVEMVKKVKKYQF